MGTENSRRAKIDWLLNAINVFFKKRPDGIISKDKLLAEFALKNATSLRTGIEILSLLEKTNVIKISGDEITK